MADLPEFTALVARDAGCSRAAITLQGRGSCFVKINWHGVQFTVSHFQPYATRTFQVDTQKLGHEARCHEQAVDFVRRCHGQ